VKRGIFLDTSGWFAALDSNSTEHANLSRRYRALIVEPQRFLTTNLVVAEMHALLSRRVGIDVGLRFLDELYREPTHEIRFVTRPLERAAIDRWIRPYGDHQFSLTDAVSFEVMHAEGITHALTLDRHFSVAGFSLIT
jgi:uncharacterized protein